MCEFENYEESVQYYLPQINKLDGKDILLAASRSRQNKGTSSAVVKFKEENMNPNMKQSTASTKATGGVQLSGVNNYLPIHSYPLTINRQPLRQSCQCKQMSRGHGIDSGAENY